MLTPEYPSREPDFTRVVQVRTSGDRELVVPGLDLWLGDDGITVGTHGARVTELVAWADVSEARCAEHVDDPARGPHGVISVTASGRSLRFLVPAEQLPPGRATALDRSLAARTTSASGAVRARRRGRDRRHEGAARRGRRIVVAVAVAVVVAAGVLLAVLSGSTGPSKRQPPATPGTTAGRTHATSTAATARAAGSAVNISEAALGAGWQTDGSKTDPLHTLFDTRSTPIGQIGRDGTIAGVTKGTLFTSKLAACLGAGARRALGEIGTGGHPLTAVVSPPFASSTTLFHYVALRSVTVVYRTTVVPGAFADLLAGATYSGCAAAQVGAVMHSEVAAKTGTGITVSSTVGNPLQLPRVDGSHAGGATATLTVSESAASLAVTFGAAYIAAAHTVSVLYVYAFGVPVTAGVLGGVVAGVERRAAAAG